MYVDYSSALEMCSKHSKNSRIFPINRNTPACQVRKTEHYEVNFARTFNVQGQHCSLLPEVVEHSPSGKQDQVALNTLQLQSIAVNAYLVLDLSQ